MKSVFLLLVFFVVLTRSFHSSKELRCLVCKRIILEMEKEISKVNPNKVINLGHRINDKGKVEDKTKPFARSELHLLELMDTICEKMDNYVRAKNKETGQLDVIQLTTDSGGMNPNFGDFDIIQDSDLNKSLKFYCEGILEEFETQICDVLHQETKNPHLKLCEEATNLCSSTEKSEL